MEVRYVPWPRTGWSYFEPIGSDLSRLKFLLLWDTDAGNLHFAFSKIRYRRLLDFKNDML